MDADFGNAQLFSVTDGSGVSPLFTLLETIFVGNAFLRSVKVVLSVGLQNQFVLSAGASRSVVKILTVIPRRFPFGLFLAPSNPLQM